jgi:hypothetical protein
MRNKRAKHCNRGERPKGEKTKNGDRKGKENVKD